MRRGLVKQILLFLGNYIIEQAGNTRLQGFILFPEKLGFRASLLLAFAGMHIECIRWNGYGALSDILNPFFYIDILAVINEVLQVVGITILPAFAQQKNSFCLQRYALWVLWLSCLRPSCPCHNASISPVTIPIAILGGDGEQTLPYIIPVTTGPQFQSEKACNRCVSPSDRFLHCRRYFKKNHSLQQF